MGFWVETTPPPQILVNYDIILMEHPSSKVSKLNIYLYCQKHFKTNRLLKVVPNDLPTQVSYPHFIHCLALTPLETELLTKVISMV